MIKLLILFTTSAFVAPKPVFAHAIGQLYTLPLPLWLYLYGAGAALIVSFLLIGFFAKQSNQSLPHINIKVHPWLIYFFQALSLGLFALTIFSGLFGSQSPIDSFAVNFFWIIFLLGFTYLSAILGNIWQIINPWKIIFSHLDFVKPKLSYPKNLAYLPALIFYFILIWLELLSGGLGVKPNTLSQILLIYSTFTFIAVYLYGTDWFKYGEFFSVYFSLVGKLSFFQKTNSLLKEKADHLNLLLFILFMLSSTAFDGFRATSSWFRFYFNNLTPLENFLGENGYQIVQTVLLLLSPLFFLSFYLLAIYCLKKITKTKLSIKDLSLNFAFSLIPIALAYNVAHYYTLLINSGQTFIALLSDPLNLGWNLLGTADYIGNPYILGASFIWHSEVVVIILGHILAVLFAHLIALKLFKRKQALISQIPMLLLMVGYTITGLWILSQPLTQGG